MLPASNGFRYTEDGTSHTKLLYHLRGSHASGKSVGCYFYTQKGGTNYGKEEKERPPIREHPRTSIRLYRRGREETLQKLYGPHEKAGPGKGRRLEGK